MISHFSQNKTQNTLTYTTLCFHSYLLLQLHLLSCVYIAISGVESLYFPHTWCVLSHFRAFAPAFSTLCRTCPPIFVYFTNTYPLDFSSNVSSSRKPSWASLLAALLHLLTDSIPFLCNFCLVHQSGCFYTIFYSQCLSQSLSYCMHFINIC